jgi:hypothetical protein
MLIELTVTLYLGTDTPTHRRFGQFSERNFATVQECLERGRSLQDSVQALGLGSLRVTEYYCTARR